MAMGTLIVPSIRCVYTYCQYSSCLLLTMASAECPASPPGMSTSGVLAWSPDIRVTFLTLCWMRSAHPCRSECLRDADLMFFGLSSK